jgi:hypothetical protein
MTTFNYSRPAELFSGHAGGGKGRPMTYRRFATAADAIRFAIETLPATALPATVIEIEDDRLDARQIREFYDSADYPLKRSRPG